MLMIRVYCVSTFACLNNAGEIAATDGFIHTKSYVLGTYDDEAAAYDAVESVIGSKIIDNYCDDVDYNTDWKTFVEFHEGPLDESGGYLLDKAEYYYTGVEVE